MGTQGMMENLARPWRHRDVTGNNIAQALFNVITTLG
jgi:hypothetical protein